MPTEKQNRTLHFRRAEIVGTNATFQSLLSKSIKVLNQPGARSEQLDAGGTVQRFINYVTPYQGMYCGHMLIYSQGAHQLLMRVKAQKASGEDAASYPLESLAAQDDADGTRGEFLESILHFCVWQNNVLVLQSKALRASSFENHCNWVLRQAKVLGENELLYLADHPKITAAAAIKQKGVKSVTLGLPAMEIVTDSADAEEKASFKLKGALASTLRAVLGPKADELKLEDALDGNISATISISWKRETTNKAQSVLNSVAVALRNLDPEDVSIRLNGGGKISGNDLKLSFPIQISIRDGIPQQTSIFKEMRAAMTTAIDEQQIPP